MNGVEVVVGWFTPSFLFCVLNLVIGSIFITSTLNPQKKQRQFGDNEDEQPPLLVRVPSFLERVKSINLSRYRYDLPDPAHHAVPAEEQAAQKQEPEQESEESHHGAKCRSQTEAANENAVAPARLLKKSASEKVLANRRGEEVKVDKWRPATMRALGDGDEGVDAKADDFINRFRQHLKLQRLESIRRYTEMLNRGTGR